ncbi:MAG: hypothetical protein LBD58_10110 [Treponema sp.]|nr:hypothetical protein [Treponema sp.]
MKRFFVLLVAMIYFGIKVYATDVCTVLDVTGKPTTDTIDKTKGTVAAVISSDSDKPVNANITITVNGFQDYCEWGQSPVTVDVFGAKCL